eukprot:m.31007 g.31007  ORF g.31007 m.31007 type:complete len:942 (+) comp9282_c0_seq2:335-3160(+)
MLFFFLSLNLLLQNISTLVSTLLFASLLGFGACAIANCSVPESETVCSVCADGFMKFSESSCGRCPDDSACINNTATVCVSGTYRSPNASMCLSCPRGYACLQGQSTACPPGTYQDAMGQSDCRACGVGRYNNLSALISLCPLIPPGFYSLIANDTGVSEIFPCTQGSFCVDGITTLCPVGTFQALSGQSNCTVCAANSYNPAPGRATPCLPVPPGSFSIASRSAIRACDPGFFCQQGVSAACPPLTFASTIGAANCSNCSRCSAIEPANVRCDATTGLVSCIDRAPPTISLRGNSTFTVPVRQAFVDPGAVAADARNMTLDVSVRGSVNISTPGIYNLTYTATDAFNNTATTLRQVVVVDLPPVVRLLGPNPADVVQFNAYTDQGIAISFGVLIETLGLPLNTSNTGNATITYRVQGGLQVHSLARTVRVLSKAMEAAAQTAANAAYASAIAAQPLNTTYAAAVCVAAYRAAGGQLQDTAGVVSIASAAAKPPSDSSSSGSGSMIFIIAAIGGIAVLVLIVALVLLMRKRQKMRGSLNLQQAAPSIMELSTTQPNYESIYSHYNTVDDVGEARYESTMYDSHYVATDGYNTLVDGHMLHYGEQMIKPAVPSDYEASADPMRTGAPTSLVIQGYNVLTQGPARYAAPSTLMPGSGPHEYVYTPKESDYAYGSSSSPAPKPRVPGSATPLASSGAAGAEHEYAYDDRPRKMRLGLQAPGPAESADDPSPMPSPRLPPRRGTAPQQSADTNYESSVDSVSAMAQSRRSSQSAAGASTSSVAEGGNSPVAARRQDPAPTATPAKPAQPVVVLQDNPQYSQEVPILQSNPAYQPTAAAAIAAKLDECRSLWLCEGMDRAEAERRLQTQSVGSFLVRSGSGRMAVSVLTSPTTCWHGLVQVSAAGYMLQSSSLRGATISELVALMLLQPETLADCGCRVAMRTPAP